MRSSRCPTARYWRARNFSAAAGVLLGCARFTGLDSFEYGENGSAASGAISSAGSDAAGNAGQGGKLGSGGAAGNSGPGGSTNGDSGGAAGSVAGAGGDGAEGGTATGGSGAGAGVSGAAGVAGAGTSAGSGGEDAGTGASGGEGGTAGSGSGGLGGEGGNGQCGIGIEVCGSSLWPRAEVRYEFVGAWDDAAKNSVRSAFRDWADATSQWFRFIEDVDAPNRAQLLHSETPRCSSATGMQGGTQPVEIWPGYCDVATQRHVIGHLLGLRHQDRRSDRDRYVVMNEAVVCADAASQEPEHEPADLKICANGDATDFGPYDLDSIMQPPSADASGCQPEGVPECAVLTRDGAPLFKTTTITARDGSAAVELYREVEGFGRFRPVPSHDPGPQSPLNMELKPGVMLLGSPAVASHEDGRLDVFALGSDQHLYQRTFVAMAWEPAEFWLDLGGDFALEPAAISRGPGRLDLVALNASGSYVYRSFDQLGWSAWESLQAPGDGELSAPAIASWGPDRLDVFVSSAGSIFWTTWEEGWSPWTKLWCCYEGKPAAVSWGPDRIDLIVMAGGTAYTWGYGEDTWFGPKYLGGQFLPGSGASIATHRPYRLLAVATGVDGILQFVNWDDLWTTWRPLGGFLTASPAVIVWPNGTVHVLGHLGDDGLWQRTFQWDEGVRRGTSTAL